MNELYLKTTAYMPKPQADTTKADQAKTQTTAKQPPPPPNPPSEAPPAPPKSEAEVISETLKENGYKPTPENKQMAKQMHDNGIPLTKENLQKMNQAVKLTQSTDKALIMLQNNAKLTKENAAKVETYTKELENTKARTEKLQTALEKIPDKELAGQCKKILSENKDTLQETVTKLQHQIQQTPKPTPETTQALQEANTLEAQIKTTTQAKNQIEIQPQQQPPAETPDATPVKKPTIHIQLPLTTKNAATLPQWEGEKDMPQIDIGNKPVPLTIKPQITPTAPDLTQQTQQTQPTIATTAGIPTKLPTMPTEVIIEILLTHGFKNTEENQSMLKQMLENGIPLTKENIQKMNQAMKLTQSSDKALFMLQNNMKLTQANAQQLEGLVNGQTKITNQINNLLSAVDQLEDKTLATQLKQILSPTPQNITQNTSQTPPHTQIPTEAPQQQLTQPQTQATAQPLTQNTPTPPATQAQQPTTQQPTTTEQPPAQTTQPTQTNTAQTQQPQAPQPTITQPTTITEQPQATQQQPSTQHTSTQSTQQSPPPATQPTAQQPPPPLPSNLQFPLANSTPQSIENYLQNLRETLSQIQQQIQQAATSSPDTARVLSEARTLESHIDFTSQIRNQIYVQLPMYHNGEQTLTNLHIYKDAKKSSAGGKKKESSSALIALETANLGHFETYVQKSASAITCQFRLDSEEIAAAVRDNIHKLESLLRDSGYSLDHFSFLPPGEPYTLVNNPTKETIKVDDQALFDKTV